VKLVEEVLRQVVHPSLAGTSGGSESRETRRLALGVYSSALEPRGQLHRPKLQRAGVSQSSKVDSHIFALYISTALQRSTLYILYTLPQVFNQTAPLLIERGFSARARVLTFSHTSVLVFCETPFKCTRTSVNQVNQTPRSWKGEFHSFFSTAPSVRSSQVCM